MEIKIVDNDFKYNQNLELNEKIEKNNNSIDLSTKNKLKIDNSKFLNKKKESIKKYYKSWNYPF